MVAKKLIISRDARRDLLEIYKYLEIKSGNPSSAFRALRAIYRELQRVGRSPGVGHIREDLTKKPWRFWSKFSYLIAYEEQEASVTVFRVLHAARDLRRWLEG